MRQDTLKYTDFSAPGVEVHCLFGSSINTVEKLDYKKSANLNGTPTLINGDGDGTVNARSLRACSQWIGMQGQNNKNVSVMELPKVDHMTVLSDDRIIKYIIDILAN